MSLFKNKYKIESIRLKDFDYSVPAYYYITICTKDRSSYFGNISNGKMILSQEGLIVKNNWHKLTKYFSNIILDSFVIMPNHIHAILVITQQASCGALINQGSTKIKKNNKLRIINNPMLMKSITLGYIVRFFKAKSSSMIRKQCNKNFYWQSLYYDHIIRNNMALFNIREYIQNNPINWKTDRNNYKKDRPIV